MTLDRMDAAITKDEQRILDAEHDILFYLGNEGAEYSFKPESGCTDTVARSTVGNTMTFKGFTNNGVTVAEDGTVTVTGLTTGRHIIKVERRTAWPSSPPGASAISWWFRWQELTKELKGGPQGRRHRKPFSN